MFVDCPECKTKFLIEPEKLGEKGRKVRCGSCLHVWHQDPAPADVKKVAEEVKQEQKENLQQAADAAAAGIEPSLPAIRNATPTPKWLKIAAMILLVLNMLAFIAFNKQLIGQTGFYDMIGDYNSNGLTISSAKVINPSQTDKANTYFVDLEVQNKTSKNTAIPARRYGLIGKNEEVLLKSPMFKTTQSLGPGEKYIFRSIKVEDVSKKGKYIVFDIGNPAEISRRW